MQFLRRFKSFEKRFLGVQVQGVKNTPIEQNPG
jgi:hypothetical protein